MALIPLAVFTATGLFGKEEIKEINWSVLWLVAGGFALGYLLQDTGLAKVLITAIPFGSMSVILVLVVAGLVCYFLSNFISNSATAALLIPILIVVAEGMADPAAANNAAFIAMGGTQAMIIFIAVCASIAMLFPISTPPNAIAASTGLVETKDMAKIGIIIGVVGFIFGFFWLTKIFPFAQESVNNLREAVLGLFPGIFSKFNVSSNQNEQNCHFTCRFGTVRHSWRPGDQTAGQPLRFHPQLLCF